MKSRWICSFLLAGLLFLCTVPAVQADESTDLTNQAIQLITSGSGNYQKAIDLIDRALLINSPEFGGHMNALELKSYAQIQLGNYTGALATLDQAFAIEESAVLWNNKGYISYMTGDYAAAVQSYNRALKIDPTYTISLLNKGNALMELGNYEDAIDAYTAAFAADTEANDISFSQQVKTWNNMGDAYFRLGKYTESAAAYQSALAIEPGNTTATAGLARAQEQAQSGSLLTIAAVIIVVGICGIVAFFLLQKKQAAADKPEKRPSKKPKK